MTNEKELGLKQGNMEFVCGKTLLCFNLIEERTQT